MTDSSGPWRDWRVVLAGATAVLSAAVVALVVRTGDPATAASTLSEVRDAAVVLADGSTLTAQDGQRVPDGATVRTGRAGGARLTTAGRDVYLGALTSVAVVDGVHERLERGQVMVDGRDGPHLDLDTRAGAVTVPSGTLVRVQTGPVLRLAVFTGRAQLTAAGRQARSQVPRLYQLQAPYVGLPGRPTPLALTDDAWEQRLAAELVNADRDLDKLAQALAGADGLTVLQAAPVELRSATPITSDRGEQALEVAVAQASHRSGRLSDTLAFVQSARDEGGSWGVVAALVNARVSSVSAVLDAALTPPGPTPGVQAGSTPAPLAGESPAPPRETPGPLPRTPGPTASPQPTTSRSSTPRATSASPTPDDLIATVMRLISPSPKAAGQSSPSPGPLHLPLLR